MAKTKLTAQLEEVTTNAVEHLETAGTLEALEVWRIDYLGRRGRLTQLLRTVGSLSLEDRRQVGSLANQAKGTLERLFGQRQADLKTAKLRSQLQEGQVDVTLPGRPILSGRLHPITQVVREICTTFVSMGFQVIEGPEVEWDKYNFEMLNIPKDHPARDMWDTLWIDQVETEGHDPMLLRTHTSPMQARIMQETAPPVRVVVPGKCYRYEATDATHEWHFFQIEGLAVDEGITFGDLKGTLYEFARRTFGPERQVRFRCDYFPFVEPGVDMSIDCFQCEGKGCPICKQSGWIEIMGAGMVHPTVLKGVGYDPSIYTGFAFGMGPERIAMLKYGIDDIRHFYTNDMRFLKQF